MLVGATVRARDEKNEYRVHRHESVRQRRAVEESDVSGCASLRL